MENSFFDQLIKAFNLLSGQSLQITATTPHLENYDWAEHFALHISPWLFIKQIKFKFLYPDPVIIDKTKFFCFCFLQLNSLHYTGSELGENAGRFRMESGEIGVQPSMLQVD